MSCFVSESKNGGTFHSFHQEEIGEIGQIARTVRRQLEGRRLLFGEYELNDPLSPKLADKRTLSKMNLTSMEVSLF